MSKYHQKVNNSKDKQFFKKTVDKTHFKNKQIRSTNPQRGGERL